MTPSDIIDRPHIDWPDWETRYNANSAVRQIPLDQASPPPVPHAPLDHAGRKINTATFVPRHIGVIPPHARPGRPSVIDLSIFPEGGEHIWRSHGKDRDRCPKCRRTRMKKRKDAA